MSPTRRLRGASTSPIRSRRGIMPVVVGAVALIILGLASYFIGNAQLDAARQTRLDDRLGLVARFSLAGERLYDPQALIEQAASLPFAPEQPQLAEDLLSYFILGPTSDPYLEVAVVSSDGTVVASRPSDVDPARYDLGTAVSDALATGAGLSPVFELDGEFVWARTIKLGGDPHQPDDGDGWGALVLIEPLEERWLQTLYHDLGSLGRGDGGLTLVDARGVAAASWDPELLGQPIVTPAEREAIGPVVSSWIRDIDGEPTIHIAAERGGTFGSSALIFQQSEADFYGDLEAARKRRNQITYLALAGSMLVLVAFALLRQRTIQREEQRASLILDATDDIIALVDQDDQITSISSGLSRLLDRRPIDWIDRPITQLAAPSHRRITAEAMSHARAEGIARRLSIALDHRDGTSRWFDLTVTDRRDDRYVGGLIVTLTYVGDRKALEDELAYRASHDQLTGLFNRAGFEHALTPLSHKGEAYLAGVVDLDRFKPLNDELGHEAGDDALRKVAAVLTDVVHDRGVVGRLGGDEFAFVMRVDDPSITSRIGRQIVDDIESIAPGTPDRPGLSASVGLVEVTGPIADPVTMMREADAAMYRAKKAGGALAIVGQLEDSLDDPIVEPSPPPPTPSVDDHLDNTAPTIVPDPSRPPATPRQRLRRAVPLIVTAGVVLGMLFVTAGLASRAEQRARDHRLEERRQVLLAVGSFTASSTGPERLMPVAAATSWDPADPQPTLAVLDQWPSAPALGPGAAVWLVDRNGQTLASSPRGRTAPTAVTTGHNAWPRVLRGTPHIPPLAEGDDGKLRFWWNLPIVREGIVNEILVVSSDLNDVSWSEVMELLGSLGNRPGGAVVVDSFGRVASGWNPDEIGTIAVDPDRLEMAARTNQLVDGPDGRVTLVERIPDPYSDRYILWQKRPEDFFSDLQQGQRSMEYLQAGVVIWTLIGVAWVNQMRERQMRRHEGRLDALLRHSSTAVLIVNREGLIDYASSALSRYTGLPAQDSIKWPIARALGEAAADQVEACAAMTAGERSELNRVPMVDQTGAPRVCDIVIQPMYDRPEIGGCLVAIRDHTDRQLLEDRLSLAAGRDPLTGLVNRAAFAAELERLQEDRRTDGSSYAVVFIDLDHFKPINDQYGHHTGDQVLIELSRRLEAAVRSEDLVARYGGDEFTVLIRNCDRPHAEATTERLLAALRTPILIDDDVKVQVGASAGVVLGQPGSSAAGSILRDADHAMYQAKKEGRGRWVMAGV